MLTKTDIQTQILLHSAEIRQFGISKIGLFGSYVRREQRKHSDIDILIDFQENEETFDNLMAICELMDEMFKGHKVEVVTTNGLSPYIGPHILSSVEYVQITH